jgi:hypothetical protein
VAGDATSVSALWLCAAALLPRVCACAVRLLCAVCMRCALRACYVCIGPMLIRHETCASVWACAGQRHFVPRTYPAPLNPLSPPSSGPNNLGTSRAGRCWGGEKRPTHCVADRHKTRRCIAELCVTSFSQDAYDILKTWEGARGDRYAGVGHRGLGAGAACGSAPERHYCSHSLFGPFAARV